MTNIKLKWMNLIRQRRKEYKNENYDRALEIVDRFMKPIFKYGLDKERKINEVYNDSE